LNIKALEQAVRKSSTCLLDSSFVLTYLDGNERASDAASKIVDDWFAHDRNRALVSVITAMEASVRPMRSNDSAALQLVMDFLRTFPNLQLLGVDEHCAFEAARVRTATKIATPDALILATGLLNGADLVLTNDKGLKSKIQALSGSPPVVYLEDFV